MVDTGTELAAREDHKERSLGAYIQALTDNASASGSGYNERKLQRQGHIYCVTGYSVER